MNTTNENSYKHSSYSFKTITSSGNGPNTLIKRPIFRILKNKDTTIYKEMTSYRHRWIISKEIRHANPNQKKTGEAIFILDKADFRTRKISGIKSNIT